MRKFLEYYRRRLREWDEDVPTIEGEWWISEDGTAQAADGDIGQDSHESMVIETAQRQLMDGHTDWDEYVRALAASVLEYKVSQASESQVAALRQRFETNPMSLLDEASVKREGVDWETFVVASGGGDARRFAMERWGWKRVLDASIETWTFSQRDRAAIVDGVWDILGSHADNGDALQAEVYIYVYATGQSIDATLGELAGKAPLSDEPQGPQPLPTPAPAPAPAFPPSAPGQTFFQFMHQEPTQTSPNSERPSTYRPSTADLRLQHQSAQNHSKDQDRLLMHPYYKGHIGDWHVPR